MGRLYSVPVKAVPLTIDKRFGDCSRRAPRRPAIAARDVFMADNMPGVAAMQAEYQRAQLATRRKDRRTVAVSSSAFAVLRRQENRRAITRCKAP